MECLFPGGWEARAGVWRSCVFEANLEFQGGQGHANARRGRVEKSTNTPIVARSTHGGVALHPRFSRHPDLSVTRKKSLLSFIPATCALRDLIIPCSSPWCWGRRTSIQWCWACRGQQEPHSRHAWPSAAPAFVVASLLYLASTSDATGERLVPSAEQQISMVLTKQHTPARRLSLL